MTTIFNFNNDDDDDMPNKINIDDLYEKKRESDLHTLNTFRKILNRVHTKIKNTTTIKKQYFSTKITTETSVLKI